MSRIRRPRHKRRPARSRRGLTFRQAMATKFDGEQTALDVTVVGGTLTLSGAPGTAGPWRLVGALPPELKIAPRFWLRANGSDEATLYQSRADMGAEQSALDPAAWDLAPTFASLTATAVVIATLETVGTIATLEAGDVVASTTVGATFAAGDVNAGTEEITVVGHGYVTGDGPVQLTTDLLLPSGISAATDYYVIRVDNDTIQLATTHANAIAGTEILLADQGVGNHTLNDLGVDLTLDCLVVPAHGYSTGAGPFRISTSGGLPAGLAAATNYWVRAIDAGRLGIASTKANAEDNVLVNLTDIGTGNQTLAPSNVDTTLDTVKAVAHGLVTGDGPLRLATDGSLPTGLSAATDYWAIRVDDDLMRFANSLANALAGTRLNLTAIGSGNTTLSASNVDVTLETVHAVDHGFVTEDGPVRLTTTGALPTGLATGTDYWVIRVSDDVLKLATTQANALAGTAVNITAIGSGNQTITLASTDVGDDTVKVAGHGMATGDGPFQLTTSGGLPTGLSLATDYWAIRVDDDHIKFATSAANAAAGTAVNLTGIGTGTQTIDRDLSIEIDLSAAAMLEWLAQGIRPETMKAAVAADADTVFI